MKKFYTMIILIAIPNIVLSAALDIQYQKIVFSSALMENWPTIVSWINQKYIQVNALSKKGYTLLSLAARQGNEEIVNTLIQLNADANAGQPAPLTQALINLVRNPQSDTAKLFRIIAKLVQHGAMVKEQDWQLVSAIKNQQVQSIVQLILARAKQQEPKPTNKVVITLPKNIVAATKIEEVRLNLDELEIFNQESFKDLIDTNGNSHVFIVELSKDKDNKWYPHVYDQEYYNTFIQITACPRSPLNRLEVIYTHPVIIVKEDGTYTVRTQ